MPCWRSILNKTRRRENELNSELRFHLQESIDGKIAQGLRAEEARREALLEFGGNEQVKEECRDVRRIAFLENTAQNLKSAVRFMRRSPGFSLTVVLTLALGIGANSAVFSAVDAVLLRALPYPDSDRLVVLHQYQNKGKSAETFVAAQRLEDWNRMTEAFQGITGYYTQDVSETSGMLPEKLTDALVAPRFLQVLGVVPALGRDFTREEEHFGGPNAILISNGLWQRRFHGDPHVLGKKLHFGKYSYPIIGVMPANFAFPDRATDIWDVSPPDAPYAQDRESTWFSVFGRLKPGITIAEARSDFATVQSRLARQYGKTDKDIFIQVQALKASVVGNSGESLWLLFGSVSLLLLIACMNIAALLLARTSERTREIAIRYSLGASRASLILQLLTESFMLALIGSAVGLVVAEGASKVFRSMAKALPRANEIALDWRILSYGLGCAMLCTLLFGLVPAVRATRSTVSGTLARHSRTQVSGSNPLQWALVGVQVALAVTLLLGAALLLRSFEALGRVSPGFDVDHILTLRMSGSWGETADMKSLIRRIDGDLDAIRAIPGVAAAATSATLPGVPSEYPGEFKLLDGHAIKDKILSDEKAVSAGYFQTTRIPMLNGEECKSGRNFNTAVLNRSFVTSFLGDQPAVGHHLERLHDAFFTGPQEIVGVVADAHENGVDRAPAPIVYSCISAPGPSPYFLVRTYGDPSSMGITLRRKIHQIEPARSVFDILPLKQQLFDVNSENRLRTLLLTSFSLTAILLATIGLYGTLGYFVSVRQREVGLRMALGAMPAQILRRFLAQGLSVACLGCVAGLALAAAFSKVLSGMLYGVSRTDPVSYFGVTLLVLLAAGSASVLPAMRAARFDPLRALREE